MRNSTGIWITILVMTFAGAPLPLSAVSFRMAAFPFQKGIDSKAERGILLRWFSREKFAGYRVFLNGSRIAELQPERNASAIRSKLGARFESYCRSLEVKTEAEFAAKVAENDELLRFLSLFDEDLADIFAARYVFKKEKFTVGEQFRFRVEALNTSGETAATAEGTATWGRFPVIEKPGSVQVRAADKSLEVTWLLPRNDDGIASFNFYIAEKESGPYRKANPKPVVIFRQDPLPAGANAQIGTYLIENLVNNKEYFIRLTSVHLNSMESESTAVIRAKPVNQEIPDVAQLLPVKQRENLLQAEIRWEKISAEKVAYLNIYRALEMRGPYVQINKGPIPAAENLYVDAGPFLYQKVYWYRIICISKTGDASAASPAVFFKPVKFIPPSRVAINRIASEKGSLRIFIRPIRDSDLKRYEVFRSTRETDGFAKIGEIKKDKTDYTDVELDSRISYCYHVQAMDTQGNLSERGKPVCARPQNSTALAPPFHINAYPDKGGVMIVWEMEAHSLLSGFWLQRRASGTDAFQNLTGKPLSAQDRAYLDLSIRDGVVYDYRLVSIATGNMNGQPSGHVSAGTESRRPEPVQHLRVMKKGNGYLIDWKYTGIAESFEIEIFRQESQDSEKMGEVKGTSFAWFPAKKGVYEVSVRAKSGNLKSVRSGFRRVVVP